MYALSAHSAELAIQKVSVTITAEGKNFLCQDIYNKLVAISGTLQNDHQEYNNDNPVHFDDAQEPYCEIGHDSQYLQYITDYISTDNPHAYLNTLSPVQLIHLYQNADYWNLNNDLLNDIQTYIVEKLQNRDVLNDIFSTQDNLDTFLNTCNSQTKATLVHTLLSYIRNLFWPLVTEPYQTLTDHTNLISSVAVHANGTLSSRSYDHTTRIWEKDAQGTYYCVQTFTDNTNHLICPTAAHSDGTIFLTSGTNKIHVLKPDAQGSYRGVQNLAGHSSRISALALHTDGTLFSGSDDATIRVWKKDAQGIYHCMQTLTDHTDSINSVVVHTDGTLCSGSDDATIRVWKKDAQGTYHCMQTLTDHTEWISSVSVHADGTLFSGSGDNTIRVWKKDAQGTYHCVQTLAGHSSPISALAVDTDDTLFSGSGDGTIRVWKLPTVPLSLEQCLTVLYLYHQYQNNQQLAQVSPQAHNVYNTLPSSIKNIVIPWYNQTPLYKKLLVTGLAASIIGAGCYLYYKWFRK
jgi:WD40 repeat protein